MSKYVIRYSRKGPVIVTTVQGSAPVVKLADGRVITAERADKYGGLFANSGESDTGGKTQYQWVVPGLPPGVQFTVTHAGQTSAPVSITPAQEVRSDGGGLAGLKAAPNKAAGQIGAGGVAGMDGSMMGGAGMVGAYGAVPQYLGNQFPQPNMLNYEPIEQAPYRETNVRKFASDIGDFNRSQISANSQLAKESALDVIDTELQGLQRFVPAAAQVQRQQVGIDNAFNQTVRSAQVDAVLPNARGDLESQRVRANTYAQGRIPDSILDSALELGTRSAAADIASAGGFGTASSAARKTSDLMSVERRLALSQYGESLGAQNRTEAANLFLAPTSYATAGQQVQVMPSVSGSQLQLTQENRLDTRTVLDPAQALNTQISQQQFKTNLDQSTRIYNSQSTFAKDQFNTTNLNNFALSKFNYDVGYANSVAGALQTSINTGVALDQQDKAYGISQSEKAATQAANDKKAQEASKNNSLNNTIATVGTTVAAIGAGISIYNAIEGFFAA